MWQLCAVLLVSAYAVDFDSLKWSEGSHPSVRKTIDGPVPAEFQSGLHGATTEDHIKEHRQKRMVNGQDYLSKATVPKYLVRIVRANRGSDTKLTWCTGSLIAPDLVLTAAWCVYDQPEKTFFGYKGVEENMYQKSVIPMSELQLIAGDWDMDASIDADRQIGEPIQYHIHPRYKYSRIRNNLEYDVAIIQVKTNFTINSRVDTIDLWDSEMPSMVNGTDSFLWMKMSGFGESKTERDMNLDSISPWSTDEGSQQHFPRYQYYAWRQEGSENCKKNWKVGGLEDNRFGYLLPDVDEGKVCFFTGLLAEVPYSVGAGDWGAPITWFDHANNKEWLMMYAPYEPLLRKGNQERGEYDYRWAARVGYYDDFIAYVIANTTATDYYTELSANATSLNSGEISLDLGDGFFWDMDTYVTDLDTVQAAEENNQQPKKKGNMNFLNQLSIKTYTFFISADAGEFVNAEITYTPDPLIKTNTTIYARDGAWNGTGGGVILKHWAVGNKNATMSVNGISNNMTIEVSLSNYEWKIQTLTLDPIKLEVTYNATASARSSVGDSCYAGYLECEDKSYCVLPSDVCDLNYDCLDGKDESIWCLGTSCKSSEYRCSTGECIPSWKLCNGNCDCTDNHVCEDENNACVAANFNETFRAGIDREHNAKKGLNAAQGVGSSVVIMVASFAALMFL